MSDSLALESMPLAKALAAQPKARQGFVAHFKAAMESLVAAQHSRYDVNEPLLYRFPPI